MAITATSDSETLKSRIRERLVALGISAREASRRAGFNVGYVGDVLEGRSKTPNIDRIMKLADALGTSVEDLTAESGLDFRPKPAPLPPAANLLPLHTPRINANQPFSDVNDPPNAFVVAIPSLTNVPGAYAVRMFSDCAKPRYFVGETLFVSPEATARIGDFVFVEMIDGHATVGQLAKDEDEEIIIEWPGHKAGGGRFVTSREVLAALHKIVGSVT